MRDYRVGISTLPHPTISLTIIRLNVAKQFSNYKTDTCFIQISVENVKSSTYGKNL